MELEGKKEMTLRRDYVCIVARRAGSMSASGSTGPEFDPLGARRDGDVYFLIARLYITCLD